MVKPITFGEYAESWWTDRTLKRPHPRPLPELVDQHILPTFETVPVKSIEPSAIRKWYSTLSPDTPTLRAHSYSLLRSILNDAVYDSLLPVNPCHIRGAGSAKKKHKQEPATLAELEIIVGAMPDRYRAMVLMAAWTALRFGELTALRRSDVDLTNGVVQVRLGVVRVNGGFETDTPKTESSIRDVAIPPHLIPVIRQHLERHVPWGRHALLFPAADGVKNMACSTLYTVYYPAREKAGRPDLRFHDLRHTGAVLAASTGATLAELMGRLGHSTPAAALRYQHAAKGRDAIIAQALSALAEAKSGHSKYSESLAQVRPSLIASTHGEQSCPEPTARKFLARTQFHVCGVLGVPDRRVDGAHFHPLATRGGTMPKHPAVQHIPDVERRLASLERAAACMDLQNVKTVRRYIAAGKLTGYRLGNRLLRSISTRSTPCSA